ncbi:PKD-like family lipoprotein [Parapedobacter sp. 10938]|uniref:PKD-like family lipoprotein n=1 Tax=Parapedobacter flavus TaxID=3110225 RepID=UPI002DB91874|nr:PKD-like family lipoprotein [Parapedobacter sp. 10938]MEC3878238.1 PKD-like family lipoprotein [Parapedobacter sp. 10938]
MRIRDINVLCLLVLFGLSGCLKDKGNYDYQSIEKVSINDPAQSSRIYIEPGQTLQLNPVLSTASEGLSYLWFVYNNSPQSPYNLPKDTLANTKDLDYALDPAIFKMGEDYRLTYKVTDDATGLSAFYFYDITVSSKLTNGWVMLEDKAGSADLAMVLDNGEVVYNIFTDRHPDYRVADPLSISISARDVTDDVSTPGKKIYLVAQSDAFEIDPTTFEKRFDFDFLFFQSPPAVAPTMIAWPSTGTGLLINEGKLSTNLTGGFPNAKKFGLYLATPNGDYDYDMAPYFASRFAYADTYQCIMYDQKHQRFYQASYDALTAFPSNASDTDIFDMNNVGLDMVKIDSSNLTNTYNAIMKDEAQAYILQFSMVATEGNPVITKLKQPMNAPELMTSASQTASTITPHVFYGAGSALYRYEISSNSYRTAHTFPANESVTATQFVRNGYGLNAPKLLVATWDGTEGKLYHFRLSNAGHVEGVDRTDAGFGKIIDMAYKN